MKQYLKVILAATIALAAASANAQFIYGMAINGGGVVGTTTNSDATAGNVGEYKTTTVAAAGAIAAAATGVSKNVTSVSLTAGDWIVEGTCNIVMTGVTMSVNQCGLGTTTDTLAGQAGGSGIGTDPLRIVTSTNGVTLTGTTNTSTPTTRVSVAATTTIFLVANIAYSAGSATQYGTIKAWRIR
jgi:hypothetical protein